MEKKIMTPQNWYKDPVIHGLMVVLVTHTLTHYKLISQFTDEDIGTMVDGLLSLLGYAAVAYSAYFARKNVPPPK